MSDTCNSRHFSWLMKSCLPNPHDTTTPLTPILHPQTNLSSLPDDLLLECLSRVPSSSISSLSLVCRRWSRLLLSSSFLHLRRTLHLLHPSLFAISATECGLFTASLPFQCDNASWTLPLSLPITSLSLHHIQGVLSHARAVAVGPRIYLIGRNATVRYDTWTTTLVARSPMIFPRKKFATAVVQGKIYVAGGGGSRAGAAAAEAVEEYDPETDRWRVVAQAPRKRYGCVGAAADGVFYVIGGLRIGGAVGNESARGGATGAEAHVYASSIDMYDVEARGWLRSRALPGGGCVVAACAVMGQVYVLASHAVELSFWRFEGRRKSTNGGGFGEWQRIKTPPVPSQVRLDNTVRFSCVGVGEKVVLVQVVGCIDDLLRRSGRSQQGLREGLVLVYDTVRGEWGRGAHLPELMRRAACACAEW